MTGTWAPEEERLPPVGDRKWKKWSRPVIPKLKEGPQTWVMLAVWSRVAKISLSKLRQLLAYLEESGEAVATKIDDEAGERMWAWVAVGWRAHRIRAPKFQPLGLRAHDSAKPKTQDGQDRYAALFGSGPKPAPVPRRPKIQILMPKRQSWKRPVVLEEEAPIMADRVALRSWQRAIA